MTKDEAISLAKAVAQQEGWLWLEPAKASKITDSPVKVVWKVISNYPYKGCNAWVRIDDKTGEVLRKGFAPR